MENLNLVSVIYIICLIVISAILSGSETSITSIRKSKIHKLANKGDRNALRVLKLIEKKLIHSCHDVSLGGILTAVSKMCIMGNKGLKINNFKELTNKYEYFFGEDQARYIVEISKDNIQKIVEILNNNSVHFDDLGVIQEKNLTFNGDINLPIEELSDTHKYWLKEYMNN